MTIYNIYKKLRLGLFILSIGLISCTSSQEKARKKITDLEVVLRQDSFGTNRPMISIILNEYKNYAKSYPQDTLSPEYLYKAAMLCMNSSRPQEAIEIIDLVLINYPTYKKTPDCLFIKGFIYDNHLKDYVNAKKSYEEFLKKYPTHAFASSAESSLKFLGKSPEEILKEIEMNKEKDSKVAKK